jgi:hypothetical protein
MKHIASFLRKLFLGSSSDTFDKCGYAYTWKLIREEWNNKSFGLLRLARLALLLSNYCVPVIHIDQLVKGKKRSVVAFWREFFYVVEFVFLLVVLFTPLYSYSLVVFIVIYFLICILHNLAGGVFIWGDQAIDPFRSLILSLFNYAEITIAFAIVYLHCDCLNVTPLFPTQALYFSAVTSTTLGFSDIVPSDSTGQMIVVAQLSVFVLFVLLFITTLVSRSLLKRNE